MRKGMTKAETIARDALDYATTRTGTNFKRRSTAELAQICGNEAFLIVSVGQLAATIALAERAHTASDTSQTQAPEDPA